MYRDMERHDIELVKEGVWIHTKNPDTGEKISIYVNYRGSPDGVIVDFWHGEGDESVIIHSFGLEWGEDLSLQDDQEPDSYEPLDHKYRS